MADEIVTIGIGVKTDQVEAGKKSLDGLAAAAANAEAATKKLEAGSAGAGKNLAGIGTSAKTAADGVKALGEEQKKTTKETDGLTKAQKEQEESTKRAAKAKADFIAALKAEADTAGLTRRQILELKAAQLGVTDAAGPLIAKITATNNAMGSLGVSAKQTAAALRGVPAQFTDIFSSLQGGQAPLTVLLQQGGQLKDMFGGVGAAARALGGYVVGLINPFTIAAAAAGTLVLASLQGSQEAREFSKALILSGNAAGATVSQFLDAQKAIAAIAGTKGSAAEALTTIAATGRVAGNNLERFGLLAVQMNRQAGVSFAETAKNLADLSKAPLESSVRLNEQYRFLTAAVYDQIKALTDRGKIEEAGELAQRAYADAGIARTKAIEQNLGLAERAAKATGDAFKYMWDRILDVGRPTAPADKAAEIQARIDANQKILDGSGFGATGGGAATGRAVPQKRRAEIEDENKALGAQLAVIRGLEAGNKANADAIAEGAKQTEARADFDRRYDGLLPNRVRMEREIAEARERGAKAGRTQVEINQIVGAINQRYDTGAATAAIQIAETQRAEIIKRAQDDINTQVALGQRLQRDGIEENTRLELAAIKSRMDATATEIELAKRKVNGEREVVQLRKQLLELDEQYTTKVGSGANRLRVFDSEQQRRAYLAQVADDERDAQERASAQKAIDEAKKSGVLAVRAYADAIAEQNTITQREIDLSGRNEKSKAIEIAQLRIELDLQRQLKAITANQGFDAQDRAREEVIARAAANSASNAAAAKITNDFGQKAAQEAAAEWKRAAEQIESSLTDALLRGFESGKGFAENFRDTLANLFKTLVLRPIIQAAVNPLAQGLTGFAGVNTAVNAASAAGSAGQAASLFGAAGTIGSFASGVSSGITAWGAGGSVTGLLGQGSSLFAGGIANGLGTIAGALGPIAVGVALLTSLAKSGETRQGAGYQVNDGKALLGGGPSGGAINQALETKLVQTTFDTINSTLKSLGSSITVTAFQAGLEQSTKGKGATFAGGTLSTGASFGQTYDPAIYTQTLTAEQAAEQFGQKLGQATLLALKAASDELPAYVRRQIDSIPDITALSSQDAQAAVAAIAALPAALLQQAGLARDQLIGTFTQGLLTGDAQSAGKTVADQVVAGIEGAMANYAATQIFDIVNQGIIAPVIDAIIAGQTITEAISQASIAKTVERLKATTETLSAIFNDPSLKTGLEELRTLIAGGLGGAGAALKFTPSFQIIQPVEAKASDVAGSTSTATKDFAAERKSLQDRLDASTFTRTQLLDKERLALDASNRELFDAVVLAERAAESFRAFSGSFNGLVDAQRDLKVELLRATGNESAARTIERDAFALTQTLAGVGQAEVDRLLVLYDQNVVLRDQITAANLAKEAVQSFIGSLDAAASLSEKYGATGLARDLRGESIAARFRELDPRLAGLTGTQVLGASREELGAFAREVWRIGDVSAAAKGQMLGLIGELIDLQTAAAEAERNVGRAGATLADVYQGIVDRAKNSSQRVSDTLAGITDGYVNAQERVAQAQEAVNDIAAQAGEALRGFAADIREFVAEMGRSDLGGQSKRAQLAQAQADLAITSAQASAGDTTALGKITGIARTVLDLSRDTARSQLAVSRSADFVRASLIGVSTAVDAKAGPAPAAKDPAAKALAELATAQADLVKWNEAVSISGAATARATVDYLKDWREARDEDRVAQSDLQSATEAMLGISVSQTTSMDRLREAIAGYTSAITARDALAPTAASTYTAIAGPTSSVSDYGPRMPTALGIPGYAAGTDYVPHDILPAADNARLLRSVDLGDTGGSQTAAELRRLHALIEGLTAEVVRLRQDNSVENLEIAKQTGESATRLRKFDVLGIADRVTA